MSDNLNIDDAAAHATLIKKISTFICYFLTRKSNLTFGQCGQAQLAVGI